MALRDIYRISDRWFAQLNAGVDGTTTSWVLKSSGATGLNVPCVIHCEQEKVLVTAVAVDTPSAGLDTLTVTRGYGGTSGAAHDADTAMALYLYEDVYNDAALRVQRLEMFLAQRVNGNGVIRTTSNAGLKPAAQGTPDMTISVAAGAAVVVGHPTALITAATLTFSAPTGNPRIDTVQIDQEGNIEVKTGSENASPSAPSVDADAFKLCEVYHRVGETSIKDADDASNGYITDARTYT